MPRGTDVPAGGDAITTARLGSPVTVPTFSPAAVNQKLWQFGFNRLTDLNEELVRGRERLFFGWQFATKAATPTAIPAYAVDVYVEAIAADPRALRAMRLTADDVTGVVLDDCGHYPAEEQPARCAEILEDFLAANR